MRRQIRAELRAVALMIGLAILGLGVGSYLVAHQRIHWPSWVPVIGRHDFILNARVSAVAGVLPGQGQAVTISGVRVGDIAGISLKDGLATATLRLQPKYAHIYPNATVLLRPKTGLKDMVAELDPGSRAAGPALHSGATLNQSQTLPTVDLDQILAGLDTDTRAELDLLVADAGQALNNGGGQSLGDVFRRLNPLSRDVARASHLVALRHTQLIRLSGNLAQLATELGDRDRQLTAFVRGNEGVFRAFAAQDQSLRRTISQLPAALTATNNALDKATGLGRTLHATLAQLDPTARSFGPTLRQLRPFFGATTPVIKTQLRPFAVAAQPSARLLVPAAHNLAKATPGLTTLATELDNIVNELAYKPPSGQSYLFYVPWANHNTNSVLANQDGVGPVRRSMVLFSCGSLQLLQDLAKPTHNPTLATLIQLLTTPDYNSVCTHQAPAASRTGG